MQATPTIDQVMDFWMSPISPPAIGSHVAPRLLQDIREGLADRWALDPYRDHLITCKRCRDASALALRQRFDVFQYMRDIGLRTKQDDELKKRGQQLQRVFKEFGRVNVVSGEASREVWNDEVLDAADRFLQRGGTASVVVGPLLSADETRRHPITELVGRPGWNVFVSLHRQPVHFRVSDGARIFYLEMPHEAAAPNRRYFFDRKNVWLASYFALRFEHVLRSPNVRRLDDDPSRLHAVPSESIPQIREAVKALNLRKSDDEVTGEELAAGSPGRVKTYDDLTGDELLAVAQDHGIPA